MNQSFWEREPSTVARSLLGLGLGVHGKEAVILHATPYEREEQERGLYKPMLAMQAGDVYCPKLMQSVLLLITTGKGRTLGSCIRIDDIELDGSRYQGPGRVSDALRIVTAKAKGRAQVVDPLRVEVVFDTPPTQARLAARPRPQRKQPLGKDPGLNKEALARLLPKIVDKYLADNPAVSFEEYLNRLLAECETEWELRKRVKV